VYAQAVGGTR